VICVADLLYAGRDFCRHGVWAERRGAGAVVYASPCCSA
jgi:hypothetical protein